MTVASLGIAVDSRQAVTADANLRKMASASAQAEAAVSRLAGASRTASSSVQSIASGAKAEATAIAIATAKTQANTAALQANAAASRMASFQRRNLLFQLNDVGVSLASGMNPLMVLVQQGSQIATIYEGGVVPALKETALMAGRMVAAFWPVTAAIGAVVALVAGLTYEINKAADVQVGFFDVALAGWQLFAEGVASIVAPVFGAIGSWLQQGWDAAAPILKTAGNMIIGTFVGSFDAIKAVWSGLPAALGDWAYQAAQVVADAFTNLVQNAIISMNKLVKSINSRFGSNLADFGVPYETYPGAVIQNPYAGAGAGLTADVSGAFGNAMGTDYMGAAFDAISGRAQKIAAAKQEIEGVGGATKAANDNAKALANEGLAQVEDKAFSVAEGLQSAFQGLGSGLFDALKQGGDIAGSVLDMLMGKLEQFASSWLDNIVNNGINALFGGGLFGGNSLGGGWGVAGGFGKPGIFGIPGMAYGGTVGRGGLSWVGENGPELLNLPAGAQVFNNQQSIAMAANSNRPVNVQTNIINNAGVEVVERTTDDGQGGVRQEIILNRAIASAVARPGPAQKAVRSAGQLVRR
jgi:hypothetical protein